MTVPNPSCFPIGAASLSSRVWLAMALMLLPGCASLHRNPVADNVIESRQLSMRGIDALERGEWESAESLFGQAIECCPTDVVARERYAESLWRRGLREAAIVHLETAVSLEGRGSPLRVQLGHMYLSSGSTELARVQAEEAVLARPKSAEAWALRGEVLTAQGNTAEAMSSYHRALGLNPSFDRVKFSLCNLYLQERRPRRALATIDTVIAGFPPGSEPTQAMLLKAIALKGLDRYDSAIEVLGQAIAREPTPELLLELAETQYLAGKPENAQLTVQSTLASAPNHPRALQLLERIRTARIP